MELGRLSHPVGLAEYAPLFTQGFTTTHWGLEPFPPNLVGINVSKEEFLARDPSRNFTAYRLPYGCGSDIASYYKITNWTLYEGGIAPEIYSGVDVWNVHREITPATPLCKHDEECSNNGCVILVDSIGGTTIGRASIVGLAHGLTSIIVFLATALAKWIFLHEPCPDGGLSDDDLVNFYRSPMRRINPFADPPRERGEFATEAIVVFDPDNDPVELPELPTPERFAEHLFQVRGMLTQLTELDTSIGSMRNLKPGEEQARVDAQQQANVLLLKIQDLVRPWTRMMEQTRTNWTPEQIAQAQAIEREVFSMAWPRY